jgi:hypothetical protein
MTAVAPFTSRVAGAKEQVASAGKPAQDSVTVPENPPDALNVRVAVADAPWVAGQPMLAAVAKLEPVR